MTDLHFRTASQLASAIRRREISSRELLDHFWSRVEKFNPKLNAIIWSDIDKARKDADAADAELAKGRVLGPLHGVPMSIKESYNIAGAPTTWGSPALANNIATEDCLAVRRLKQAGAVFFAKTNVPLMLADWQSYNEVYGHTGNPWDTGRTPGGSSGGSAATLAAGMTGIDAGSDIGSSIRNPAHYCGVFGHKPTWGIVSPFGHALPGGYSQADISVIGPLARGADDLEIALDAMSGADELDGVGWQLQLPGARHADLSGFRVAVMWDHPLSNVDNEYIEKLEQLAAWLTAQGATVTEAAPDIDLARQHELYVALLRAATSGRTPDDQFNAQIAEAATLDPNDSTYYARMVRANTMRHRDWLAAHNERNKMRYQWAEFFRDYDVFLCPVASGAAFPHDFEGERWDRTITVNGKEQLTTDQLFWAGISGVVLLPATTAPIGLTRSGLPVGVQIVTANMEDRTSIHFAKLMEKGYQAFEPPPGFE